MFFPLPVFLPPEADKSCYMIVLFDVKDKKNNSGLDTHIFKSLQSWMHTVKYNVYKH